MDDEPTQHATPVTPAGRRRSRALNLLVLVVTLAASLAAAELALRLQAAIQWKRALVRLGIDEATMSYVGTDRPGLYWPVRPLVNEANSRGDFDVEHTQGKPPGTFRVVVIGDSVVVGYNVGWRGAFPRLLEASLARALPDRRWEVVTLGCSGYRTSQELVLLRTEAFEYAPDLIVWSNVFDDPTHAIFRHGGGDLWLGYRPPSQLLLRVRGAWFLLREAIAARHAPREWHARLHAIHRNRIEAEIATIGRICREHRTPAVFFINPVLRDEPSFDGYPLLAEHTRLRRWAAAAGLVVVDLPDAYAGRDPRTLGFPPDPWHPDRVGHRIIAEYLQHRLVELELVSGGL